MKKVLIIIAAFVLFFAALGYFLWREGAKRRNAYVPGQTPQTTSQPFSSAPADTSWRYPDFNFARLSGDSLHLYSLPIKSDSTLAAAIQKDELDNDYIKLIAKKGSWYQNEDSLWIPKNEIVSYYDSADSPYNRISMLELSGYGNANPEEIINFFSKEAQTLNGELTLYSDSILEQKVKTIKTANNVQIIGRRKEGYFYNSRHVIEVFKVKVFNDNNDSIIGWAKAEDMVMYTGKYIPNATIISGNVGFFYDEPSATWNPARFSWLKTNTGFVVLGFTEEYWTSPDKKYNMVFGDGYKMENIYTVIRDSTGKIIFKSFNGYTSPAWYNNYVFTRGLCGDDAIYKINLKDKSVNKLFSCSLGTGGGLGGEDAYFSLPAPIADTLNKSLTVTFVRATEEYNEKTHVVKTSGMTYTVVLSFSGKVLSIDSTNNN